MDDRSELDDAGTSVFSPSAGRRSGTGFCVLVVGLSLVLGSLGCVSAPVSDLTAYPVVAMNQVVPYPSREEMRHRSFDVVLLNRDSPGIDRESLEVARVDLHRTLDQIATDAGASVVEPPRQSAADRRAQADGAGCAAGRT